VVPPTLLTQVPRSAKLSCEEAFGPIVVVEKVASFAEGVAAVNDSKFGLQAGIFSNRWDHMILAYNQLEVGGVVVNDAPSFRMDHMPYGGVKESGFGREGLKYAMEEMTELKILILPDPA